MVILTVKDNENTSANLEHTARLRPIKVDDEKPNISRRLSPKKIIKRNYKMSDTYKKKYIILGVSIFLVFVFAYQFVKVKEVNFDDLGTNLKNSVQISEFNIGDDQMLRRNYGIDTTQLENYVYIAPKSNMQASEILVIKCKPGYVDHAYALIQDRINKQSDSYKNYAPDQYKIISSSDLKKSGDYIYFISSDKVDKVKNAIEQSYK